MDIFSIYKIFFEIFRVLLLAEKTTKKGIEKENFAFSQLSSDFWSLIGTLTNVEGCVLYQKLCRKTVSILNKRLGKDWQNVDDLLELLECIWINIFFAEISGGSKSLKLKNAVVGVLQCASLKGLDMSIIKIVALIVGIINGIINILNNTLGKEWKNDLKSKENINDKIKK